MWGIVDYASYPLGMLLVAPILLHNLGMSQFGIWAVAMAIVSAGSVIASGFGDANIQSVATCHGAGDARAVLKTVRSAMAIHLILGSAIAVSLWLLAPPIASRVVASAGEVRISCLWSIRGAALLVLVRAVETVCISTHRAFQRYGPAVRISVVTRLLSLGLAAALAFVTHSVAIVVCSGALVAVPGLWIQIRHLSRTLQIRFPAPHFDRDAVRGLLAFGIFSWLQAVSGVIISQADRLITGISLGAATAAAYALCAQLAQPLYGLTASGMHSLFPYLSGSQFQLSAGALRRKIARALIVNGAVASIGTTFLLVFGMRILRAWAGDVVAQSARPIFALVVWSTGLLAMSVTGNYVLLALGRVRAVTAVNILSSALMFVSIRWLLPRYGISGIAVGRLLSALVGVLLYIPVALLLYPAIRERLQSLVPIPRKRNDQAGTQPKLHSSIAAPAKGPFPGCANVLGVRVEALNIRLALARVEKMLSSNHKGYVSVIGVHGIMESLRNPHLATIYAASSMTIPDGMPTVWVGRLQGCRQMQRVTGPDLMLEVFASAELSGCTHFLYGGREGVAEELSAALQRRFPSARIVGTYTPPYRDLSCAEEDHVIAMVRRLQPDIIWVGISTPRQEEFMHRYLPVLDTKLMFGVGAAFDFHTGRIRDSAAWVKLAGLQWLHRLIQDPRRLWRRYLRNNSAFLWHIVLQVTGLQTFPSARSVLVRRAGPKPVVRNRAVDQESA